MAIPLKEGLQIRCAFQGTAEQGKQLLEKIRAVGRLRELNEGDAQRQKQDVVGGLVVRWAEEGGDMRRQAYRAFLAKSLQLFRLPMDGLSSSRC